MHLLRRATYGPTTTEVHRITRMGPKAWLDEQLEPESISDRPGDEVRRLFPELGWSVTDVRRQVEEFDWGPMFSLGQGTVGLAIWSRRQLHELMVEFWSNHLNVACPSDDVWDSRPDYDRTVIRRHALGRFDQMLLASATHPAMLRYLNNADSTKRAPNENYGRELLELHTVGIGAGYSQADVVDSARILTGWSVGADGLAKYRPGNHYTGHVSVLDFNHPNSSPDGRAVVEAYLHHLAHHSATAEHIAFKLCQRFVDDDPPQTLVRGLTQVYLQRQTAIRPVLRTLFHSSEFARARRKKFRTPYEDVVATVRVLGHRPQGSRRRGRRGIEELYWMTGEAGQAPLAWQPPNGYPMVAAAWQSAAVSLARWNHHQSLVSRWWPNKRQLRMDPPRQLLGELPERHAGVVRQLAARLLFEQLTDAQLAAVLQFVGTTARRRTRPDDDLVTWRVAEVAALILDSPAHTRR